MVGEVALPSRSPSILHHITPDFDSICAAPAAGARIMYIIRRPPAISATVSRARQFKSDGDTPCLARLVQGRMLLSIVAPRPARLAGAAQARCIGLGGRLLPGAGRIRRRITVCALPKKPEEPPRVRAKVACCSAHARVARQ